MRCSISNMGFAEFNKHFLYAAVGAPGSTHDVRFLCRTSLFKDILNGHAILDKHIFILSIFWNSASDYCGR